MGGRGSSSKSKAPKTKSNKISSQRKKSRRKVSEKRRRDYDSVSDDVLSDSEPTSSSTSEADYKRKKNNKSKKPRRRDYSVSSDSSDSLSSYKNKKAKPSRIDLKSIKKKARNRSSSPVRKRKRSSRDRVGKTRKKLKKSKKHLSNSNSESCSTCQSSDEDHKRSKIKKTKRVRGRELYKVHKKRKVRSPSCSSCSRESYKVREEHRVRSPICSSCSRNSEHSLGANYSDIALAPVNNSRRLKSVISVVYRAHDEGEDKWEKEPNKEEIVYNLDGCRPPKSPESNNEGRNKRELDDYSRDTSNKRIRLENVEATEQDVIEGSDKKCVLENNFEERKESDVSDPSSSLKKDDLESILRKKALENLRKFKGVRQTGPSNTSNLKTSEESEANNIQNESTKQGNSYDQEMDTRSGPGPKSGFSQPTKETSNSDGESVEKHSGIATQAIVHPPIGEVPVEEEKSMSSHTVSDNPSPRSNPRPDPGASNNPCSSSTTEPMPSDRQLSEENSLGQQQQQNEAAKDGSEFEKKTMSVMRGGEMVQVSYKVYIPKRAPALARRPLRR